MLSFKFFWNNLQTVFLMKGSNLGANYTTISQNHWWFNHLKAIPFTTPFKPWKAIPYRLQLLQGLCSRAKAYSTEEGWSRTSYLFGGYASLSAVEVPLESPWQCQAAERWQVARFRAEAPGSGGEYRGQTISRKHASYQKGGGWLKGVQTVEVCLYREPAALARFASYPWFPWATTHRLCIDKAVIWQVHEYCSMVKIIKHVFSIISHKFV